MQLVNETPFAFAPLPGRLGYPSHSLTFIVKGTFDLRANARAEVAPEQTPVVGDLFHEDDEAQQGSLLYESDFVPEKAATDLLFVGNCHCPQGKPLVRCPVTFQVGKVSQQLVVSGDRDWSVGLVSTKPGDPTPFTSLPLRYEHAFGGVGYDRNPLGKGFEREAREDGKKIRRVPNIEDPKQLVESTRDRPSPAGWGPIGRSWKPRVSEMGTYGKAWFRDRAPWFPADMKPSYFNAAPENMRVRDFVAGDEDLYLENLHPEHAELRSSLPGIRVRAFLQRTDSTAFEEVPLRIDTLWIHGDRAQLILVWRGHCEVASDEYEDIEHVYVASEQLADTPASAADMRLRWEQAQAADEAPAIPGAEPPTDEEPAADEDDDAAAEAEADASVQASLAAVRAKAEAAGFDIDAPPALTPEQIQDQARLMRMLGVADEAIIGTGIAADNLPPPPSAPGEIEKMKGLAHQLGLPADEALDAVQGEEEPATEEDATEEDSDAETNAAKLTRDDVVERAQQGESFAGSDLRGLDLSALALGGLDFTGAQLDQCNLRDAQLQGANLSQAVLRDADLTGAQLAEAQANETDLQRAQLVRCNFEGAVCTGANFAGGHLDEANFQGADLTGATLDEVQGQGARFDGAKLAGTQAWNGATLLQSSFREIEGAESSWHGAQLDGADFTGAQLASAEFAHCGLPQSIFTCAVLRGANLRRARLTEAKVRTADLFRANLEASDLSRADFSGAMLYEAILADAVVEQTEWSGANLKKTRLEK